MQVRKSFKSPSQLLFVEQTKGVCLGFCVSSSFIQTCNATLKSSSNFQQQQWERKYESGRVSLASCPLMAYPITRTWALHRTCAQEAWRYCCYTTETGYALFANLGSLSCPQTPSHHYEGDERRAQRMCELQPILDRALQATRACLWIKGCVEVVGSLHHSPKALDTSGKVFNIPMAMTCRVLGCRVGGEQEHSTKRERSQRSGCSLWFWLGWCRQQWKYSNPPLEYK